MGSLVSLIAFVAVSRLSSKPEPAARARPADARQSGAALPPFSALLDLPPEKTADFDTATLDLLCGSGLPGTEDIEPASCLARLGAMAARVASETARNLPRFQANPAEYRNSEAFYKMGMLVTVVREDFDTRYNPALISAPGDSFFSDASDVFIQGLLSDKKLGTCSSMPVLYTAVARRLGYPVFLVAAKGHLFCRWDGAGERMNFEGTGQGVLCHPDSYYKNWPRPISDAELARSAYLKNLSPRQELAVFLLARAECLLAADRKTEALLAAAAAMRQAESTPSLPQVHRFIAAANLVPPEVLALLAPPRPFRPRFAPRIPGLPPDPETEMYRRSGLPVPLPPQR